MNNIENELSISALRSKQHGSSTYPHSVHTTEATEHPPAPAPVSMQPQFQAKTRAAPEIFPVNGHSPATTAPAVHFDPWHLVEAVALHWFWLVLGAAVLGGIAAGVGYKLWPTTYTASAQLIRYDAPQMEGAPPAREISPQTLKGLMRAPELLARVSAKAQPPISPELLAKQLVVTPQRESDLVTIEISGKNSAAALNWANLYAAEAATFTQELPAQEITQLTDNYIQQKLDQISQQLAQLNGQMRPAPPADLNSQLNKIDLDLATVQQRLRALPQTTQTESEAARNAEKLSEELQTARTELFGLLGRYTEVHPLVQQQRAKVAAIEKQWSDAKNNLIAENSAVPGAPISTSSDVALKSDFPAIKGRLQTLASARLAFAHRQQEAKLFAETPSTYYRVLEPASAAHVLRHSPVLKLGGLAGFGAMVGFMIVLTLILLVEIFDARLKNSADVRRITKLPLLASLGNLRAMSSEERETWAFRTWTAVQGRLQQSASRNLICGITSSASGEGRSTWINLLAHAAMQNGLRVLTIVTPPAGNIPRKNDIITDEDNETETRITADFLNSPREVTSRLNTPEAPSRTDLTLPPDFLNAEVRSQLQTALAEWSRIPNLVILLELPPASLPETVMIAGGLPNVMWLSASGRSDAAESHRQLETLRFARCHLVGAVLNRESKAMLRDRFPRWAGMGLVLLATSCLASAADPATKTNSIPLSFSVNAAQRGAWQQRLTLGPGDVLNFSLFGEPEQVRAEVPIAPDGRVSFLEAQDVMAAGLTIDELRTQIDEKLSPMHHSPHSIITPVTLRSKKFFLLGNVMHRGVMTLDRPRTIIEAVAQAGGFQIGLAESDAIELVDFSHSFLARQGKRLPVDFEKLFQQGDLSQNIPLEPNDYLYFPASQVKEIYVLGAVVNPGALTYRETPSTIGAIAARGGFTSKAWTRRVLVVRGSLNHPKTYMVDAGDILLAKAPDFQLEPNDLVYVSNRPWARAEELLDLAATAFVESAIVIATSENIRLIR